MEFLLDGVPSVKFVISPAGEWWGWNDDPCEEHLVRELLKLRYVPLEYQIKAIRNGIHKLQTGPISGAPTFFIFSNTIGREIFVR